MGKWPDAMTERLAQCYSGAMHDVLRWGMTIVSCRPICGRSTPP